MSLPRIFPAVFPAVVPAVIPPGDDATAPPSYVSAPTISADGQLGDGTIFTAVPGIWDDADTVTGRWQIASAASPLVFVDIPDATTLTFELNAPLNEGDRYRYRETATNAGGDASRNSNVITLVGPSNTVAPAVTGTVELGETLTCGTGTWTGLGNTYAYQWYRDGEELVGETTNTYTLAAEDDDASIVCEVTASNAIGTAEALSNSILFNDPLVMPAQLESGITWDLSGRLGDVLEEPSQLESGITWDLSGSLGDATIRTIEEVGNFPYAVEGWADIGTGGTEYQTAAEGLSPVGHWPANDAAGTTVVASVGGVNAALAGTFAVNQGSPIDGGRAVSISLGQAIASGIANNPAFTVATWVSPFYLGTTNTTLFSLARAADLNDYAWRITCGGTTSTEFARFGFNGSTGANLAIADRRYTSWVHLVVAYEAGVATIYVNGESIGTIATALRSIGGAVPYAFVIGGYSSQSANARYAQASLFDRALSGAEVTSLYDAAAL